VDVHNLEPDTSLVVFEELYIGEEKVGSHSDINAKDQTINIIDLKTKVESSKGSQVELAGKDVVLKDKVT
ncbi:VaFE repeat-containing surface-anchored protein, partial [Acinetobacter baumannii]|nr:VaFE repeat-containing surface-anchored protein [Acinetobacter baumannii]